MRTRRFLKLSNSSKQVNFLMNLNKIKFIWMEQLISEVLIQSCPWLILLHFLANLAGFLWKFSVEFFVGILQYNSSVQFFSGILQWNSSAEFFSGILQWNSSVEFFSGILQ